MSNSTDVVYVFVASPAYAYKIQDGADAGQMRETHLDQEYLAGSYEEALRAAVAWARERFKNCMESFYPECFFSSLKVYVKAIAKASPNGSIDTRTGFPLFEWKYDDGYTVDEKVDLWLAQNEHRKHFHPSNS